MRADGPQRINLASNLVPGAPPPAALEAPWSREDQDVCQAGPQGTIFAPHLVLGAPPYLVSVREGCVGGSRRTRFRAGLVPGGPGRAFNIVPAGSPAARAERSRAARRESTRSEMTDNEIAHTGSTRRQVTGREVTHTPAAGGYIRAPREVPNA